MDEEEAVANIHIRLSEMGAVVKVDTSAGTLVKAYETLALAATAAFDGRLSALLWRQLQANSASASLSGVLKRLPLTEKGGKGEAVMLLVLLLAFFSGVQTPPPAVKQALKDDGFGVCPAFSHPHPTRAQALSDNPLELAKPDIDGDWQYVAVDGLCHNDEDESVTQDDKGRKVLPKPGVQLYTPDKKPGWP
jgi:hypothetical protein